MELAQCHQRGPTPSPKDEVYGFVKKGGKHVSKIADFASGTSHQATPAVVILWLPLVDQKAVMFGDI